MGRFKPKKMICPHCDSPFNISGRKGSRECPECGERVQWGPRF